MVDTIYFSSSTIPSCEVIHLDLDKEETVEESHSRLQESVLSWGNLLTLTGGSLKPRKCFYHLISFDFDDKGRWKYANNHKRADLGILIPHLRTPWLRLNTFPWTKHTKH
jgi:hypothetical protein